MSTKLACLILHTNLVNIESKKFILKYFANGLLSVYILSVLAITGNCYGSNVEITQTDSLKSKLQVFDIFSSSSFIFLFS